MRYFNLYFFSMFCTLILACSNNDDPPLSEKPSLENPVVTNLTVSSADLSAVISGSQTDVIKRGFCYSITKLTPTTTDNVKEAVGDKLELTLSALQSATTYYVRAYLLTSEGTIYSAVTSFKTLAEYEDPLLAQYQPPVYSDNYTSIAAWSQRDQWNLANVHDPTVFKADDGYYYMYQTDASYGNAHSGYGHFHGRRSKDLVNWEYLGATMPENPPSWAKDKLNEYRSEMGLPLIDNPRYGYWAPVARKVRTGLYRMYYCLVPGHYIKTGKYDDATNFDNSWTERALIGVMECSDPASNQWVDKGYVICSASNKGINEWTRSSTNDWEAYFMWNAIDPSYVITPEGEHWLVYGSWHSGFTAVQLNAETGKPLNELGKPWSINGDHSSYGDLIARRGYGRWQASEAPEIIYNSKTGYYYLFMAYDELSVAYNTRVARSKNIKGPYVDMVGKNITENGGGDAYPVVTHPYKFNNSYGWVGISHCAIFNDGQDNWFYASQGRLPANITGINASNAVMMGHVRSIRWTDEGWPLVMPERYGAVPSVAIKEEELVGEWEHINMGYNYQKQFTSVSLKLNSSNISEGALTGSWNFDATKQTVTVGGVKLYLQREVDWEISPRKLTIVYAGYSSDGKTTYWGKKIVN